MERTAAEAFADALGMDLKILPEGIVEGSGRVVVDLGDLRFAARFDAEDSFEAEGRAGLLLHGPGDLALYLELNADGDCLLTLAVLDQEDVDGAAMVGGELVKRAQALFERKAGEAEWKRVRRPGEPAELPR